MSSSKSILESMSPHVRRRLSFDILKQEIDSIVDYELHVCRFPNAGEFIGEVCDMLNERILDDIVVSTRVKVSLKEKDELYFYLVDTFGNYLGKKYKVRCTDGISESKKPQKYIEVFQELIDFNLNYISNECEKENHIKDVSDNTCDQVEQIEKIKVEFANWSTVNHSNKDKKGKQMYVKVMIYYSSIRNYVDFDDLIYDLNLLVRKSTGMSILLDYDSINSNTSFEW
jgi:hypothetical protein